MRLSSRTGTRTARQLRRQMSLPEVILWQELRKRPGGMKFRRQHPAGRYVLDFYCEAARMAVEIDGEAHQRGDQPRRDAERDEWLAATGLTVVRIPAKDVLQDLEAVMRLIMCRIAPLHQASPGPPPLQGG